MKEPQNVVQAIRIANRLREWGVEDTSPLLQVVHEETDRRTASERVLLADEVLSVQRIKEESDGWYTPSVLRNHLVVILKATRLCNLRCTYCHAWREGPGQVMSFETAARSVATALVKWHPASVDFVWHGGEVTTLSPHFFYKLLWLQAQFAQPGQVVRNSIQSNGLRMTPEWVALLRERRISVGISIDGAAESHDAVRRTIGGRATFNSVLGTMTTLTRQGVPVGALVVVTSDTLARGAATLLDSLADAGVTQVALLNEIPDISSPALESGKNYVPFHEFVAFMRDVFRHWWKGRRSTLVIREIEAYMAALRHEAPRTCTIAGNCMGGFVTIDPDGTVAACDKYVGHKAYVFGSVMSGVDPLGSPEMSAAHREASDDTKAMSACPYLYACRGGCPNDNHLTRRLAGEVAQCCGLRPLFDDIAAEMKREKMDHD